MSASSLIADVVLVTLKLEATKKLTMEFLEFIDECDALFVKSTKVESEIEMTSAEIYSAAREYIGNPKLVLDAVNYLRQKLIIRFVQKGDSYLQYFPVLDFMRNTAKKSKSNSLSDFSCTDWKTLLKNLVDGREQLIPDGDEYYKKAYAHYHRFARSYIRLKSIGIEFQERYYKIHISKKSNELIQNEIDRICKECGGNNLQRYLSDRLRKIYNPTTKRFMEFRRVALGIDYAATPFGYLIAIISKYVGTSGRGKSKSFDYLVELITDIIVVFEIQPYSELEFMYFEPDSLIEFIRKNFSYDWYVGIYQINPSHASAILQHLKNEFSVKEYLSFGVSVKDAIKVSLKLISFSDPKNFSIIDIKTLSSKLGMAKFKVAHIMDNVLSTQAGKINKNLSFPPLSTEIDHYFRPTIKKGSEYIIYPKSITSLGCINAVCSAIGRPDDIFSNPLDSKLGYAIEDFLREYFVKKGINVAFGDSVQSAEQIEADMICETRDYIYIFELKKKGLTRDAQSGSEVKIYQDIADSALRSHFQAMRIERALKDQECVTFSKNGIEKTVYLNGRSVKRISVSLHDFGALQDKIIFQRVLTIATHSKLDHPIPSEDKKLDNWRYYSNKIRALAIKNNEIGFASEELKIYKVPFHNSLFMSISQLIMMLEATKNQDEFFGYLESFMSMTNGSRDVYTEFLHKLDFFKMEDF